MTVHPPVSRFAVLLAVLALFAAQIAGVARSFVCDCSGVVVAVESDHCVGPHGASCHEDAGDVDHHHDSEGDRREHSVQSDSLVGVAGVIHPIPMSPLLAILPSVIAAYSPPPATLEWQDALRPDASPPPEIVRTVVLLI